MGASSVAQSPCCSWPKCELDACQPLALAVGKLPPDAYWDWVHRPSPGSARFFASSTLEALTRCPWWLVPALWLPAYAAVSTLALGRLQQQQWHAYAPDRDRHSSISMRAATLQLAVLQLAGLGLWQALEYGLHRYVFHARVTSRWSITVHFLLHGNHHKVCRCVS